MMSELIHRRVIPFDNSNDVDTDLYLRKNIAILRCLSTDRPHDGTPDVWTGEPYHTVPNGSNGEPPKACIGLSITPNHTSGLFVVEPDRAPDDFSDRIRIGGKNIRRFYCFCAPSNTLPRQYKIHYDKPDHGHIYSSEICMLERPDNSVDIPNSIYYAILPEIADMPWSYCCSLLAVKPAAYRLLIANTYTAPVFVAEDVASVFGVVSEIAAMSIDVSTFDKAREACDWLEDNFREGVLDDLVLHPAVLSVIIGLLTEYQFEATEASRSIFVYELLSALESLVEELEARPQAGTSEFLFAYPLSIW